MKTAKILPLLFCLTLVFVSLAFSAVAVQDTSDAEFIYVGMFVGNDETERNLAWKSQYKAEGLVMYGLSDDGALPADYKTATAVANTTATPDSYSYMATMRGLTPGSYVYQLKVGDAVSEVYSFEVYDTSEGVSFLFAGDAQISNTTHANYWSDTLNKVYENFDEVSLVVSAGDQGSNPFNEEASFGLFKVPELTGVPAATSIGTMHDDTPFYWDNFNLPNLSSNYGLSDCTSDYFYTYEDILFVHLSIDNLNHDEHIEFLTRAANDNADCKWKFVVLHYSFYSGGSHVTNTPVIQAREALAGPINELGYDMVLSGHDHVYSRSLSMVDAYEISSDVVTDNTVTDPEGTTYVCGTSSSGSKFYDGRKDVVDDYIDLFVDDNRKAVVMFDITDTTLEMKSYFVDGTTPELFDSYTIIKTTAAAEVEDYYTITYVSDYTLSYGDDISDFTARKFTSDTPDAPIVPAPKGSIAEGVIYDWTWEYRDESGDVVDTFVNGNDYTAYLVSEEIPVSDVMYIANTQDEANRQYTWANAFALANEYPNQHITFMLEEDITLTASDKVVISFYSDITLDLNGYTITATAPTKLFDYSGHYHYFTSKLKITSCSEAGTINMGTKNLIGLNTYYYGDFDFDIENVNINCAYLVYGENYFSRDSVLNLDINGGTVGISTALVYVNNYDNTLTSNTYNITLNDVNFDFGGSASCLVRSVSSDIYASVESSIAATGCTFTDTYTSGNSSSRYLIREDIWKGTATFNDCDLVGMSIGMTVNGITLSKIRSITVGEGCTFRNSKNTFKDTTYSAFCSSKLACASGCVIAKKDSETVEIVKKEEAVSITWANPVGYTDNWLIGTTPVYMGASSFTAGSNTFSVVLAEEPTEATEDKTYSFTTSEGYLLRLDEDNDMWQISLDGGVTYQDITEDGTIEIKYVLTVTADGVEKKYTAVADFWDILTEYSDSSYGGKEVYMTFEEDITCYTSGTFYPAANVKFYIDLAGHTLDVDAPGRISLGKTNFYVQIYSSQEGGHLSFNAASENNGLNITRTGTLILGDEEYKDTLTVSATTYLVNISSISAATVNVKFINCTIIPGTLGMLRLNAKGGSWVRLNAEILGCALNVTSANPVLYNSSSDLTATTNGGVYTADSYINFADCTIKRTSSTNPKEIFGHANFTDRYFGKVNFENCMFDTVVLNGNLIYSDEVLEYNDYYSTLTDYDPTKAINVGEGCMFKNYGATFSSDFSTFTASNVNIPENCTLAVQGDYVVVVPADGVVIDLGEKQAEANVRYIEANGIRKETAFDEYYVPSSSTDHIVAVIEKTSDDTAELVKSEYYYVDMTAKKATKLNMDSYMHAYDEKSIRIKEPMGIRFKAHILTAQKYEETDFVIDEYGYIVATEKHLDGSELTFDTQKKATAVGYSREEGINTVFEATDEMHIFTGILNNIPVKEYKTNLVCKTYTKITVNGKQFVLYGEAVTGNVYETAQKLLEADPGNVELIKIVLDGEGSIGVDIGGLYN